jgi:hypothetical protein
MGRMMLYYGNVSPVQLQNFRTTVIAVPYLSLNVQPIGNVIEAHNQVQQLITMSSTLSDFSALPTLQISFM